MGESDAAEESHTLNPQLEPKLAIAHNDANVSSNLSIRTN